MKAFLFIAIVLSFFCQLKVNSQIKFEEKDKIILEQVFEELQKHHHKSTSELVVLAGKYLKETPYVAHILETEKEQLVINLRELDCTTYAENCLAIARTIKSKNPGFNKFVEELINIRYRNGVIDSYPSRLHYFSDWIYENDKKGLIRDVSKQIGNTSYPNRINFMSTHPESYKQLKSNPNFVEELAVQEKEISARKMFFLPKDALSTYEDKLVDGDIIGITTSILGLDIKHVGIIVKKDGQVHLMHASSKAEKVIISENTLQEYLMGRKSATGIMVARPL